MPKRNQINVRLAPGFTFLHEPIRPEANHRFAGRKAEIQELVDRLKFSEGGSFLITGYRGVGKTSFVNQALLLLGASTPLLDIFINLARPLTEAELMHLIVRRLYDRLVEKNWYRLLEPELQRQMTLAYQRTSANVVRKMSQSWERSLEAGLNAIPGFQLPVTPKLSGKRSRKVDLETSFLAYDDKAAEHDVISIARALSLTPLRPAAGWRVLLSKLRPTSPPPRPLKIVFVFDEMDKLDDNVCAAETRSEVEKMLAGLKNLFTTSGICFLFVAGKDLHERWLKDLWSGDSVYESVFSYDKYLPCMWTDVDELCGELAVFDETSGNEQLAFESFKHYLRFKGRGIPRRILRAFNEMVAWEGEAAHLAFPNEQWRRINFYAQLNQLLEKNADLLFGGSSEEIAGTRFDRQKLGILYVVDWILRQGRMEFTASAVLSASRELSSKIALAEQIARSSTLALLDILVQGEYLQTIAPKLDQVAIEKVDTEETRYRLTDRRLAEMSGIGGAANAEDESVFAEAEGGRRTPGQRFGGYELHEKLGEGGMGVVYHAWDTAARRYVALKLLHPWLTNAPNVQERFRRELATLRKLKHPNIVPFLESGEVDSQLFLAMEFIEGLDLGQVIKRCGALDVETAIDVLLPVAQGIEFAHQQGFARLDVKSGNIRLAATGKVYLMDLGIAKHQDDVMITDQSGFVGTPSYLAPEQLSGKVVDQRADIYSFGIVLYETLTGNLPFVGRDSFDVGMKHLKEEPAPPSKFAAIPAELEAAILRCLKKDPDERFQDMGQVIELLKRFVGSPWQSNVVSLVRGAKQQQDQAEQDKNSRTLIGTFTVIPPQSVASAAADKTLLPLTEVPWLEVSQDPNSPPQHCPLTKEITTIGRDPDNDICLSSATSVSRYQARILLEEGRFSLIDLNSSNGTYLNGERVLSATPLKDGDQMEIGAAHLVFHGSH